MPRRELGGFGRCLAVLVLALIGVLLGGPAPSLASPTPDGLTTSPAVSCSYDPASPHVLANNECLRHPAAGPAATAPRRSGAPSNADRDLQPVVAAEEGDGLVNLASDARTTHILEGDGTGGGHLWPGAAGKTPFPQSWSRGQIMHEISDIATDPAAWENAVQQGSRTVLVGTRGGVEIRVIVGSDGEIITGYPIKMPRNP